MKSFPIASAVLIFFIASIFITAQSTQNFLYSPEKPKPGNEIIVSYNPAGTKLEQSNEIKMFVYQFGLKLCSSEEYTLEKVSEKWTGKFSTLDSIKGIVILFESYEGKDNNKDQGFVIYLHDDKGNILPGAKAGLATVLMSMGDMIGIDVGKITPFKLFEEEFFVNPFLKKDFMQWYFNTVSRIHGEKGNEIILTDLKNIGDPSDLNEEQLNSVVNMYSRLKLADKAEPYEKFLAEKYPNGTKAQQQKFAEFRLMKDTDSKIIFAEEFKQKYPQSMYCAYFKRMIVEEFMKADQFEKVKEYLDKNISETVANDYNNLAWQMYKKETQLELALEIAKRAVELGRNKLSVNPSTRYPYETTNKFLRNRRESFAEILDTYSAILTKLGKNQEALENIKEAVELTKELKPGINNRYCTILMALGKYDDAKIELEKFVAEGIARPAMKEMLKQIYDKQHGNSDDFENYYFTFVEKARQKKKEELKRKLIEMPAPQFTLSDLEGNSVSLADLKGKIIVVDFWATWCGPCLASFPAIKKAVEKFQDDPNVKFLFVNTWENVVNKKQNAADFIKKNNYPFQVLLDEKNEVVSSYNVSGIPTKFIIDKEGNIRLKSVGFGGTADDVVEELSILISILN